MHSLAAIVVESFYIKFGRKKFNLVQKKKKDLEKAFYLNLFNIDEKFTFHEFLPQQIPCYAFN